MGLGNILLSGSISAPKTLKRACRLAALAALALGFAPGRAAAQACPGSVTGNYALTADIVATSADTSPCITVGGDNTTVNLNGHKLDVSVLGDGAVAIQTGTTNNTTIVGNGGTIITAYATSAAANSAAIESTGGTNLTITGVTLDNEVGGNLCASSTTDQNWGTAISANGVTGATIGPDSASCYQTGISVQNSVIPQNGKGSISGNTLTFNTYAMYGGTSEIYSAGLVLSNSSGWSVNGNTINYNGSPDPSGTCVSPTSTTGEVSCAFGLQIINGSSANSISSNTVDLNFVGGIYTGPDTSGNTISQNTALNNGLWDIWDDAPKRANTWRKNTCGSAGGTINPHTCH